jgi:AraC-like DNA-binding protein
MVPLRKVALRVGYNHVSNFVTAFRRVLGEAGSSAAEIAGMREGKVV